MNINNIINFFINPADRFEILSSRHFYDCLDDREYVAKKYKARLGTECNLEQPKTFNEKIQWLKIHDHNSEYPAYVDKFEVKQKMKSIIGEKYIIPTLGLWNDVNSIPFEKLPSQFVLKCTHDSGGLVICKDKNVLDLRKAKRKLKLSMTNNYYYHGREWPYSQIKPRIIAEQYMVDESDKELKDYKIFVFDGEPFCIQVDYDRYINHKRNFYDLDWNYMPFTTRYPTDANHQIKCPTCLNELLALATKISNNLGNPAFVRTDFYIINESIYFGEVTFYHGSGYEQFLPKEYDDILGEKIILRR